MMPKTDYSKPDPELIERVRSAPDEQLSIYLENAKRKLPATQWLVDAIADEQVSRGGLRNLTADSIRQVILTYARSGRTCSYKTIANELGVSWEQAHWRLPGLLGDVSRMEHDKARPFLTAIVVSQKGDCGGGFFEMARKSGASFIDETQYQDEEQQRVFEYWKES
jgi:hypothetical protein